MHTQRQAHTETHTQRRTETQTRTDTHTRAGTRRHAQTRARAYGRGRTDGHGFYSHPFGCATYDELARPETSPTELHVGAQRNTRPEPCVAF